MKLVIAKDTDKFFGSQLRELNFSVDILAIDPENPSSPSWESIPECDAFFYLINFYSLLEIIKNSSNPS